MKTLNDLRWRIRKLILPLDDIVELLGARRYERCLDLGAGTGVFLEFLYGRGVISSGVGLDINPRYYRTINPQIRVTGEADIEGEKFDLLIFSDVLHHVEDAEEFFRKYCGRYLAPGGDVLVKDMDDESPLCRNFNKLHDLIFSGQRINDVPASFIRQRFKGEYRVIKESKKRVFLYDHYYMLLKRANG